MTVSLSFNTNLANNVPLKFLSFTALFTTAKTQKQPKSPSTDEWIKKMWCIYTHNGTLPVNPKGNQPWILIERADAEAEAPILWPPKVKSWLTGKDPDARKDWGQKEKGSREDEMVGWHHRLNGHEFEQPPGDSERQGSLVCCSSWGCKESDTT